MGISTNRRLERNESRVLDFIVVGATVALFALIGLLVRLVEKL